MDSEPKTVPSNPGKLSPQDLLKLDHQVCFPIYAASRLITQLYQPMLQELGLTYPQYLIMMILWEKDDLTIGAIGRKLFLNTNTLTPLLKRMENHGLVNRKRSSQDERQVLISLTEKGRAKAKPACQVPLQLLEKVGEGVSLDQLVRIKEDLTQLIEGLTSL